MKTLLSTLSLSLLLAIGVQAQVKPGNPGDTVTTGPGTRYSDAMKNLPQDVKDKIDAARLAADAAKAQVEQMKTEGKTPEEIQAMITERRAAALANLQKALDALNNLPAEAKERVSKAKENISKRMQERKGEAAGNP